jgi:hypothetical protein
VFGQDSIIVTEQTRSPLRSMSSIAPRQALPSGGRPLARPHARSAMQLPGQEIGPQDWRGAASASWGCKPAKPAVARPPFIIGGRVDTARRLKIGGEPYDASDECQSLGRFNLAGSNGLRREVDGVQMAESKDEQSARQDGFE